MSTDSLQVPNAAAAQRTRVTMEVLAALAGTHFAAGRWAELTEAASNLLQLDPRNESALYAKGIALVMQKEIVLRAQAREVFERLLQLNPGHVPGAIALADVYLA